MYALNVLINIPLKKKYVRANQANFMDTELNQVIIICSKLPHKCLNNSSNKARKTYQEQCRSNKARETYQEQRNVCVNLLKAQ